MKRPVIRDVAKHAGVSTQTVSRVINNNPSVRPTTRAKVLQSMKALDYQPNAAAQMLASGTSRSVGVIAVGDIHHGLIRTFSAIQNQSRNNGFSVVTANMREPSQEELEKAFNDLRHRQVMATFIVIQHTNLLPLVSNYPNLIVISSAQLNMPNVSSIGIDQATGIRLALNHLWDQGVSDTVYVSGNLDYIDAAERSMVYQRLSRQNDKPISLVGGSGWGCQDGYDAAHQILKQGLPEAIITGNDKIAVGLMRAMTENGFTAGKDYRLIGCDDDETSAFLTPSLTTIFQDFLGLADECFKELLRINEGEAPRTFHLPTSLRLRESSVLA